MRLNDFAPNILNEALFLTDRMSAFDAIRKYPSALTHFSSGGADYGEQPLGSKLGVNPRKTHGDPHGIYFYFNRWLLNSEDVSDSQFATNSQHYWVCSIKNSPNTINLASMTSAKIVAIAKRNGWLDDWYNCVNDDTFKWGSVEIKSRKLIGAKFWAAMDYLVNEAKTHSWGKLLRGVDAIIDPGKGIINDAEPAQVIVFNRKLITVLEHGDNKNQEGKITQNLLKEFATKIGGNFYYKHKIAYADFQYENCPIQFAMDSYGSITTSYFSKGYWLSENESGSHYTMDRQSFTDYIMQKYNSLKYKNPEPTGLKSKWNQNTLNELTKKFKKNGFSFRYSKIRDGKLGFWTGHSGMGFLQFMVSAEIDLEDNLSLHVEYYITTPDKSEGGFRTVSEAKGLYPKTVSNDEIAADIKQQLTDTLKDSVTKGYIAKATSFRAHTGLDIEI